MLPITDDTVRLFLHVIAATIWVGGQLVLAGLLPTVRSLDPDGPRLVARAYNRLAWPALAVLVATGVWNTFAIDVSEQSTAYHATFGIKMTCVLVSAVGAVLHIMAGGRKPLLAAGGAMSSLGAVGALFFAMVL